MSHAAPLGLAIFAAALIVITLPLTVRTPIFALAIIVPAWVAIVWITGRLRLDWVSITLLACSVLVVGAALLLVSAAI